MQWTRFTWTRRKFLGAPALSVAVAAAVAAAALILLAIPFADGKATEHAQFHGFTLLVVALLASAAPPLLRALAGRSSRTARLVLVGALWFAAGAVLLDGVGAFAYDADDEKVRVEALDIVHYVGLGAWAVGLALVVLGVLLVLLSLVASWRRRT